MFVYMCVYVCLCAYWYKLAFFCFVRFYRQVEDLQFQLLEQGVISGDQLERTAETSEERVATLTIQLEEEKNKVRQLESQLASTEDGGKLKEIPEQLTIQLEREKERVKELEAQLEVN